MASLLMYRADAQALALDNQYHWSFKWEVAPQNLFNEAGKTRWLPFQNAPKRETAAPAVIRADTYVRQMAWSCRQEWKLEQATRLPLRLRLGSKEQTDWLEGKNNASGAFRTW